MLVLTGRGTGTTRVASSSQSTKSTRHKAPHALIAHSTPRSLLFLRFLRFLRLKIFSCFFSSEYSRRNRPERRRTGVFCGSLFLRCAFWPSRGQPENREIRIRLYARFHPERSRRAKTAASPPACHPELRISVFGIRSEGSASHVVNCLLVLLSTNMTTKFQAFFDETGTHAGSSLTCVAGYLFSAEEANEFTTLSKARVRPLLPPGVEVFHASAGMEQQGGRRS